MRPSCVKCFEFSDRVETHHIRTSPFTTLSSVQCLSLSGFEISDDCWPVLVTVTEGEGDPKMSVSWFVPSGGKKAEISDPLVKLESKPEATIYVR